MLRAVRCRHATETSDVLLAVGTPGWTLRIRVVTAVKMFYGLFGAPCVAVDGNQGFGGRAAPVLRVEVRR
jgi:hypothetical protein